jgi:hypothetical protein
VVAAGAFGVTFFFVAILVHLPSFLTVMMHPAEQRVCARAHRIEGDVDHSG